jgi:hypothetical protein
VERERNPSSVGLSRTQTGIWIYRTHDLPEKAQQITTDNYQEASRRLLDSNFESLSDCERLIVKNISEGTRICRDINLEFDEQTTFGQRLADRVTALGGS